ncbi:MAG TPA: DUF5915 domain-containing protein [Candidatus Absconditabacterales bacterium]|nr:DUF5915 domain-containing protein [Candidatus Absconditabacterales bacterium]HMT27438.1 DUF5915 domain-containing protein [Candidatus Absconditabacterales bacterium]
MQDNKFLQKKYEAIIKEEVNVKELGSLPASILGSKVYKPLGKALSAQYGKETARIIELGKQGQVREQSDGSIVVFGDGKERTLQPSDYELGFEGDMTDDMAVEGEIVVKLDLELDAELLKEGLAREISRAINQYRKDSDCQVDQRITLEIFTESQSLKAAMTDYEEFLKSEALVQSFSFSDKKSGKEITIEDEVMCLQLIV